MPSNAIAKLNNFHEQFARWYVANPEKSLHDAREQFGYSISWLSRIANSDAFKARIGELSGAADALTIADVPSRLRGLAENALEKLESQLDEVILTGAASRQDRDFVKDTGEMALKALGYIGSSSRHSGGPAQPPVSIHADQVIVSEARDRILNKARTRDIKELEVFDGESQSPA